MSRYSHNRKPYQSPAQRRIVASRRMGVSVCVFVALTFSALLYGAYKADEARGISVSESLASAGIGARQPERTWSLIVERKGESDIAGYNLTYGDCMFEAGKARHSFDAVLCELEN